MLLRCLKVMKIAKSVQACQSKGLDGCKNAHATGKIIEAKIDPSDTNLVKTTTPIKVTKDTPNAIGASARKVPAEVATPLPPLNLIKGENVCPKIAKIPAANDQWYSNFKV